MKPAYIMILNDIDPVDFRELYNKDEYLNGQLEVIKFNNIKPTSLHAMDIDLKGITTREWKHVFEIEELNEGFRLLNFITSYGKTISNFGNEQLN